MPSESSRGPLDELCQCIYINHYPGTLMCGTTGSRSGVLRDSHGHAEDMLKIHIIDERVRVTDFAEMTKLYSMIILNLNGA